MQFNDFYFFNKEIEREESEQQRNDMVTAAFVGWQIGGSGKSFDMYLDGFGLLEKETPLSKEEKNFIRERSLETAERIKEAMLKGNYTKVKVL